MKKILSAIIALTLLVSICSPVFAVTAENEQVKDFKKIYEQATNTLTAKSQTDGVIGVEDDNYPESDHNYSNDTDQVWIYRNTDINVTYLQVTFSANTLTEWNFDHINIYEADAYQPTFNCIGSYTGDQLAGKTLTFIGRYFAIQLVSDYMTTDYGFAIDEITGCTGDLPEKVPVEGIELSSNYGELATEDGTFLSATVNPSNAYNKNIIWKTSNRNVAFVNEYGAVYALSEGTAIITATTDDGNFTATCELTVVAPSISIKIDNEDAGDVKTVKVKWYKSYRSQSLQMDFDINTGNVGGVYMESSNSKVGVDELARITNIKTGARSSVITVTLYNIDGEIIARDTVKVIFYKYNWQLKNL